MLDSFRTVCRKHGPNNPKCNSRNCGSEERPRTADKKLRGIYPNKGEVPHEQKCADNQNAEARRKN